MRAHLAELQFIAAAIKSVRGILSRRFNCDVAFSFVHKKIILERIHLIPDHPEFWFLEERSFFAVVTFDRRPILASELSRQTQRRA